MRRRKASAGPTPAHLLSSLSHHAFLKPRSRQSLTMNVGEGEGQREESGRGATCMFSNHRRQGGVFQGFAPAAAHEVIQM